VECLICYKIMSGEVFYLYCEEWRCDRYILVCEHCLEEFSRGVILACPSHANHVTALKMALAHSFYLTGPDVIDLAFKLGRSLE
jgi:hypothetical protein